MWATTCLSLRSRTKFVSPDVDRGVFALFAVDQAACFAAQLPPDLARAIDLLVVVPDALNLPAPLVVALDPCAPSRGICVAGLVPEVRRRGNRHDGADRLDPVGVAMVIDELHHHFGRRGSVRKIPMNTHRKEKAPVSPPLRKAQSVCSPSFGVRLMGVHIANTSLGPRPCSGALRSSSRRESQWPSVSESHCPLAQRRGPKGLNPIRWTGRSSESG